MMTKDKLNSHVDEDESIRVVVAQAEDHERILNFLREHYYKDEPLTVGSEPKQQDAADEEFNMSNIKHGTCLMILRNSLSDNCVKEEDIVAVALAGPKDIHEADHIFEEATRVGVTTKWGRILKFLGHIERCANVFQHFNVSHALHVHVLAVHRDARCKALGRRLMQELMKLGREKGFPVLVGDCSSVYSARLCERLSMQCINTALYEDYRNEKGEQEFKPPKEHDAVRTYAILL